MYFYGGGTSVTVNVILGLIAAGLLGCVLYVFWMVLRAPEYSRRQKAAQLYLMIVFPIFGAALVYAFLLLRRRQMQA